MAWQDLEPEEGGKRPRGDRQAPGEPRRGGQALHGRGCARRKRPREARRERLAKAKDIIRRKLGITATEALTAGNGQTAGTATSETTPDRPVAAENRFTMSKASTGTVLSIVATLVGAFIVYSLNNLSNTMENLSNTMETRFAEQATSISVLDNRISALDNKYDAKIDALIKTVSDMRVDIGKLQTLMTGQLAPVGDTARPGSPDDSAGAGNPGGSAPTAAGPEPGS